MAPFLSTAKTVPTLSVPFGTESIVQSFGSSGVFSVSMFATLGTQPQIKTHETQIIVSLIFFTIYDYLMKYKIFFFHLLCTQIFICLCPFCFGQTTNIKHV